MPLPYCIQHLRAAVFFPVDDLWEWGALECHLQGHPDRLKTAGVDMTSGILGHGIAIGAGLALAARFRKSRFRTYVVIGDGESQGGIIWEGAMTAAKYRLSNLTVILDYNDVQLDGAVHDVMPLEPVVDKWKAFNWGSARDQRSRHATNSGSPGHRQ
jgi:transketolase